MRRTGWWSPLLKLVATTAVTVLLWQAVEVVFRPPAYLWPSATSIADAILAYLPLLIRHGSATASAAAIGFSLAIMGGFAGAVCLHISPRLRTALWPLVIFTQVTPKVAIAPLLLVWLGYGVLPKLVIAFLIAFFPVMVNTLAGLEAVPEEEEELAQSMQLGRARYFLWFELPFTTPYFFTGAKVAMTLAVVGTVIGEFVGSNAGLGRLVLTGNSQLNGPLMYAAVLSLGVLGLSFYAVVVLAERLLVPWHVAQRKVHA